MAVPPAPRTRPTLGARPLRRDIQRYIVDELWELMICHKNNLPDRIDFMMNGEEVLFMPQAHALSRNPLRDAVLRWLRCGRRVTLSHNRLRNPALHVA